MKKELELLKESIEDSTDYYDRLNDDDLFLTANIEENAKHIDGYDVKIEIEDMTFEQVIELNRLLKKLAYDGIKKILEG